MKLENWIIKIALTNKSATPNDLISTPCQLEGYIFDSPEFTDGEYILTAYIISIKNGVATTYDHKEYVLGRPIYDFYDYVHIKNFANITFSYS